MPPPPAPSEDEIKKAHETLYAAGLQERYAVTGPQHVERSLSSQTPFNEPMQSHVTAFCWGTVWNRPGLSKRDRSLLNIVMLCALNRATELGVHVRGAVRNGCIEVEIREALLQASVYCGMPAGMEGFRVAERVINEMKEAGEGPRE
ncbi:MAG: hypothetical protein Q9159_005182, partial [Coniocarpon cinnabarinum]